MNWDEDIDLLAGKKAVPKEGRRRSSNTLFSNNSEEILETPEAGGDTNKEVIKARKTGVWTDEATKSAGKNKSGTNIIELERFQTDSSKQEDDIPEIPDIDDLQDDPLNLPDVKPIASVDKSTYKELDNQLGSFQSDQMNFGNLGDIDLSFLTNKLYPEKEIQFKPEIWTMESLFNDLSRSSS